MNIIRQRILETVTKQPTTISDLSQQFRLPSEYIQTQLQRLIEEGNPISIEKENVYLSKTSLVDYGFIVGIGTMFGVLFYWGAGLL
ncbi:hypothetical protein BhaS171_00045 [Bacillus phage vB_BhaS-171]|uniref:hypothetical protein n=1 Tax=Bacillus phage vB_BhaS-171 TaxID=1775140 RepID=UPI000744D32F|nr:hypothetical protein BH781_gp45 [Bacillus phage vB_BhaS-171]ALY08101.1 hypothetical protein BhaS171_00045 [Bacillus phage vB_BhaS-171]